MSYPPHHPYQTDNGHGVIPLSVSMILILILVQVLHLRDPSMITEGPLPTHIRLRPPKLATFHGRVARCQLLLVPGQSPPARHNPIPIEQGNTGNVSTASDLYRALMLMVLLGSARGPALCTTLSCSTVQ